MNSIIRKFLPTSFVTFRALPHKSYNALSTFTHSSNMPSITSYESGLLAFHQVSYNHFRHKSQKTQRYSDDEEDVDYNDDKSLSKDSKVVKIVTTSLRLDLILKSALGISRNKVEVCFYEGKIRLNSRKVLKKSTSVKIGDEIDLIKSVSPKNPDHLTVSRVEILNIGVKDEKIHTSARRFKSLLIENYETDPYKPSSADHDQ